MTTCALVIGHKKTSPGAQNETYGVTEFDFNEKLAMEIETSVQDVFIQRVYRRTFQALPHDINELGPDFIISLHCNAFNKAASGTEVLYYYKSESGKEMAEILNRKIVSALDLPDRGILPRNVEDRGGYLLKYTNAPCVIAEPFFIDNDRDYVRALERYEELVAAYVLAIDEIEAYVTEKTELFVI